MDVDNKKNGYALSRQWFDYAFENPDMVTPNHHALYFWAIELCNRLAWKDKFGLPTTYSMEALGIKSYKTYKKTLDDLIKWGFIKLIQKARNNHTSNIIELVKFTNSHTKSMPSQVPNQVQVNDQVNASIDKQEETIKTIKPRNPEAKPPDFIDSLISLFLKTFPDYKITNRKKERGNAGDLLKLFKEQHPGKNSEEMLTIMGGFFTRCKNIPDNFYQTRMSLGRMLSDYNIIMAILSGKGKKTKGNPFATLQDDPAGDLKYNDTLK